MSDAEIELSQCPVLARSRRFSLELSQRISDDLQRVFADESHAIHTIMAAGSLGRLEASEHSDVDCIVIVDEQVVTPPAELRRRIQTITEVICHHGLRAPKADGIYCQPINASSLLDRNERGSLREAPNVFGSRMQVLLDARPLYRIDNFNELRRDVLSWYSPAHSSNRGWTHLLNDLSRYLHAYAVWQQFKFTASDDDGWYLRQAKMRTTRITTFAALMFLVGETSRRHEANNDWLLRSLAFSPLSRLAHVFSEYSDISFDDFLATYETLHELLTSGVVRKELISESPTSIDEVPEHFAGAYAQIHALSETLMDCLTQFVLARKDDWPPTIFRNLLL